MTLDVLSRELGVSAATLAGWKEAFLAAGQAGLKSHPSDSRDEENAQLKALVGDLTLRLEIHRQAERLRAGGRTSFHPWEAEVIRSAVAASLALPVGLAPVCKELGIRLAARIHGQPPDGSVTGPIGLARSWRAGPRRSPEDLPKPGPGAEFPLRGEPTIEKTQSIKPVVRKR